MIIFLTRIICCFIPVAKFRRELRAYLLLSHKRTRKLFEIQYDKQGMFQAYDTCVRYAFAREYLQRGLDPEGFWYKMYVKMQSRRGTVSDHNPERFINLIKSYVSNGYNREKIELYANGTTLADGSHRLALNLLFGCGLVYFVRNNRYCDYRNYGLDWFKNNGFTPSELSEIRKIKAEIFKRYKLKQQMD